MCTQTQKHAHTCSLYMVVCVCKVYLQPPNLSRAKPKSADFRLLDVGTKIQCCCHFCSWVGRGLPVFSCHNRDTKRTTTRWEVLEVPRLWVFLSQTCKFAAFNYLLKWQHKSLFSVTVSFQCSNKSKQEKVRAWCCMDRKLVALAGMTTVGTRSTKRVVHCCSAWCLLLRFRWRLRERALSFCTRKSQKPSIMNAATSNIKI